MKKYLRILPFLAVTAADFWILPLFLDAANVMLMILIVMPAVCFGASFGCGLTCGFQPVYLLGTELLYLPTVWVYYNDSALVYLAVYAVIAALGLGIGAMIKAGISRTDPSETDESPETTDQTNENQP